MAPNAPSQLKPRQRIVELGPIPNWACAVDFATTDDFNTWNPSVGNRGKPVVQWRERTLDHMTAPDKMLCASGHEPQGSITELRYGLPANVIAYFETHPTKRAWVFRTNDGTWPLQMLMASPGTSDVLLVSADLSQAEMAEPSTTKLDTASRTLAAFQAPEGTITQVSETCITVIDSNLRYVCIEIIHAIKVLRETTIEYRQPEWQAEQIHSEKHTYPTFQITEGIVEHAAVRGNFVCISVFAESRFKIHTFRTDGTSVSLAKTYTVDGEVTCLGLCCVGGQDYMVAGLWRYGSPSLAIYKVDKSEEQPLFIRLDTGTAS